jgi:hypothetical protein
MAPVSPRNCKAGVGTALAWLGLAALAVSGTLATGAQASPRSALEPWPPADQRGHLYVHFGEEHVNDVDGDVLLPKVVQESARYRPELVTMSGDKADDGEPEQLQLWLDAIDHYDAKDVPWFAGVGNHDRLVPPGIPGGTWTHGDFSPYREFFADRPYPMGDAPGYGGGILPRKRDATDPEGAASHYFVDAGPVRWVFIDNSCWSITQCDSQQTPSGQNLDETQLEFLARVAGEASEEGRLAFVVMHLPTQDPGDQIYRTELRQQHIMGKLGGAFADNALFEQTAAAAGVDGVFVAHIKGQFLYRGAGGVPYFIDGGAGGELYTTGPVGTDHGYWHGFRVINVRGERFTTDAVPIFVDDGIEIAGPDQLALGERATFAAFGRQPVFEHSAKVDALELRDPDPVPRSGAGGAAWIVDAAKWLLPAAALPLVLLGGAIARSPRRRRLAIPALAALGGLAVVGGSAAQQSEPTSTPVDALPNPARIWTSSDPLVLEPVASESDDPRRAKRAQTADGEFRATCPGRARLTIASGFESASAAVEVPSAKGAIVHSLRPGTRELAAGRARPVARLALAQRARVVAVVRERSRKIATLERACARPGALALRWDGRDRRGRPVSSGTYRVDVRVLSDRRPVRGGFAVRVAG